MLLVGSGLAEGWGSQFRVTCLVLCSMKLWALLLKEDFDFELWCPTCVTDTGSAVPGHGQHLDFSFCSGWRAVLAPGDQRGPCRYSCSSATSSRCLQTPPWGVCATTRQPLQSPKLLFLFGTSSFPTRSRDKSSQWFL